MCGNQRMTNMPERGETETAALMHLWCECGGARGTTTLAATALTKTSENELETTMKFVCHMMARFRVVWFAMCEPFGWIMITRFAIYSIYTYARTSYQLVCGCLHYYFMHVWSYEADCWEILWLNKKKIDVSLCDVVSVETLTSLFSGILTLIDFLQQQIAGNILYRISFNLKIFTKHIFSDEMTQF